VHPCFRPERQVSIEAFGRPGGFGEEQQRMEW